MKVRNSTGTANRLVAFVAIAILLALCATILYVFYKKEDTYRLHRNSVVGEQSDFDKAYEKDSDGDGLADWEEILWSTDPDNPDTDGDGISDRTDVYESMTGNNLFSPSSTASSTDDLNATQTLARDFFNAFMLSLQKGTYTSQEEQDRWVRDSIVAAKPLLERAPIYDSSEIRSIPSTQENRVRYVQSVQAIVVKMLTNTVNENVSLMELGQGQKEKAIANLTETAHKYKIYSEELRNLPVPEDALSIHENMMRALLFYIFTLEGFTVLESDPLQTALAAQNLPYAKATLNAAFTSLREYINKNGIPQNPSILK